MREETDMASAAILETQRFKHHSSNEETILPVSHQQHTIVGWKNCRIVLRNSRAYFCGITADRIYKREDTSVCPGSKNGLGNMIPGTVCDSTPNIYHHCGFYAWSKRSSLSDHWPHIVQIELFGSVVEHERGYRATKQRILGLYLPQHCFFCANDAPYAYWSKPVGDGPRGLSWSLCENHIDEAMATSEDSFKFELSHLSNMLGVEVSRYDQYAEF